MLSLNLSLLNQPVVVNEDKMYKDLNRLFYKKNTETAFIEYKKTIDEITQRISSNREIPNFNDPSLQELEHNDRKTMMFYASNYDKFKLIQFTVESSILVNKKTDVLYKIYSILTSSPHVDQLKCIFYNEIYHQLKAHEVASENPHLIVPNPINYFVYQDDLGRSNFIFEMEFVRMTRISNILNRENSQSLFNKIQNVLLSLNAVNIYHNDLNPNNIQLSTDEPNKIVLIDFGEASNEPTNSVRGPNYLFFDRQFSKHSTEVDYKAFVKWATEDGRNPLLNEATLILSNKSSRKRSTRRSSRSRSRSQTRSSSRSPSRETNKNKTARVRSNSITNNHKTKKSRDTSRGRSLPRDYTYSPRGENQQNNANKDVNQHSYYTL